MESPEVKEMINSIKMEKRKRYAEETSKELQLKQLNYSIKNIDKFDWPKFFQLFADNDVKVKITSSKIIFNHKCDNEIVLYVKMFDQIGKLDKAMKCFRMIKRDIILNDIVEKLLKEWGTSDLQQSSKNKSFIEKIKLLIETNRKKSDIWKGVLQSIGQEIKNYIKYPIKDYHCNLLVEDVLSELEGYKELKQLLRIKSEKNKRNLKRMNDKYENIRKSEFLECTKFKGDSNSGMIFKILIDNNMKNLDESMRQKLDDLLYIEGISLKFHQDKVNSCMREYFLELGNLSQKGYQLRGKFKNMSDGEYYKLYRLFCGEKDPVQQKRYFRLTFNVISDNEFKGRIENISDFVHLFKYVQLFYEKNENPSSETLIKQFNIDYQLAISAFNKMQKSDEKRELHELRWISIMSLTYHHRKHHKEFASNINDPKFKKIEKSMNYYSYNGCDKLFWEKNVVSEEYVQDETVFKTYYIPSTKHIGFALVTASQCLVISHYLLQCLQECA